MTRNHEKLLIAALAGLIIAGAAVFAVQPAMASAKGPLLNAPLQHTIALGAARPA